jgi:hypothetical protein
MTEELEAKLSGASEPESLSLGEKLKRMQEAVCKLATKKGNKWFVDKCERVNEEKNACRANAI